MRRRPEMIARVTKRLPHERRGRQPPHPPRGAREHKDDNQETPERVLKFGPESLLEQPESVKRQTGSDCVEWHAKGRSKRARPPSPTKEL